MKITVAKSAGFCFGVNRALKIVDELIGKKENIYTLGPIIHNDYVVNDLKSKGVQICNDIEKIKKGDTIVLRSHGVSLNEKELIKQKGADIIDATCPFVQKIQQIVQTNSLDGKIVLIAGDPNHPEVRGIKGHCLNESYVFQNAKELEQIANIHKDILKKDIIIVSQTTFSLPEWEKCLIVAKKLYTNAKIFDTICSATSKRQREAEKLSKESDLMIVIGGRNSSNTAKLNDICQKSCQTYLVENALELPISALQSKKNIGVTAGASAPANIIEEVIESMTKVIEENQNKQEQEMNFNFEAMLEESLKNLNTEDKVHGVVISVNPSEVYVDVGRKQAGIIPRNELSSDPDVNPADIVKVGDELDLLIMRTNDQEGTITLSKKRIDIRKSWDTFEKAKENGDILKGIVREVSQYGLIVNSNSVNVFIPRSQASASRYTKIEDLLDQEVEFRIIEIDSRRRRVIGSIRSVLQERQDELSKKFWETAKVGDKLKGTVVSIKSYGAFIDLGGVDGLAHISELSWKKIHDPSEVLKIGDTVEVTIKSLDPENKKVGLTYRNPDENPWNIIAKKYNVGDIIEVQITGIVDYGVFAKVIEGVEGLIHISEISNKKIDTPKGIFSIGDKVKVKILMIDAENKKIKLSSKQVEKEEIVNELSNPVENSETTSKE